MLCAIILLLWRDCVHFAHKCQADPSGAQLDPLETLVAFSPDVLSHRLLLGHPEDRAIGKSEHVACVGWECLPDIVPYVGHEADRRSLHLKTEVV